MGARFPGDENETLQLIQHRLYWELLFDLYECSRRQLIRAADLLDHETELTSRLREIRRFDHRTLQDAHDMIAAYYRFAYDPRGQIPLFLDGMSYEQYLETEWREWYSSEVVSLSENDDVARSITLAVAYENTEIGYVAEDRLKALLECRYLELWNASHEQSARL